MLIYKMTATGNAPATPSIDSYVIFVDTTSGAITATLPDATLYSGHQYWFVKTNSGINALTIGTTSSQTIIGSTTFVLPTTQYASICIVSNGSSWDIIATFNASAVALIATYNGIATSGNGVPAIYGSGRSPTQTAAVASVATYTVDAVANRTFIISANVNITAAVTCSFTVICTYTDETNASRTLTLNFSQVSGTFVQTLTNVLGVGAYEGVPLHIRAKASTSITIATTGTFTSVTYNVESYITQIG